MTDVNPGNAVPDDTSTDGRQLGPTSPGHLLDLIRSRSGWTRQQLLAATGMSRTTLFERLDLLFGAGLVYAAGSAASGSGRPAHLLRFDDRGRVVVVFDLGQTHGRISVANLAGRTLRMATLRLDISDPPEKLLPRLMDIAGNLLDAGQDERLVGIGMGIPGPVEVATGRLGITTTMPGWDVFPIQETLRDRWDVPVFIENDARALALGESSVGTAASGETLLAVKYSHGIGAGIVVGDTVIGGADGAAGDIGHIRATDEGPECRCGREGCVAAWASGRAILDQLRTLGARTLDDVVARANAADAAVDEALRSASRKLGRVLSAVVATVNPHLLVLGGPLGRLPVVVSEIDASVHADAVDRTTRQLTVIPSRLGDEAETVGLTAMVARQVFSPTSVNQVTDVLATTKR